MSTDISKHRFPIAVAIDGGEYSQIVLEHALDQAARHDHAYLHFVMVAEDAKTDLEERERWLTSKVMEGLDAFAAPGAEWRARVHVRRGKATEEIPSLAAEVNAELLVIGNYGTHHRWRSVADRILENAPCPVLVVGLTGHEEAVQQCPACVEIREESDGERWFCAEHAAPDRMRLSSLVGSITSDTRGGLW